MTINELELFAYHVGSIYRDTGKFGLSCRQGIHAEVEITPNELSVSAGDIWDSVTINGRSVGNRCGGARAYARMVAGNKEWWRA